MERWRCLVGIPVVEEEKRVVKGKQSRLQSRGRVLSLKIASEPS